MKNTNLIFLLIAALLIPAGAAAAETLQGVISEMDRQEEQIILNASVRPNGVPAKLKIYTSAETNYEGIHSLDEVEVGDSVTIQAEPTGLPTEWRAVRVTA